MSPPVTGVQSSASSMFLAAKYEEIYPFKMRHVYEKIGHRKLSKKRIK